MNHPTSPAIDRIFGVTDDPELRSVQGAQPADERHPTVQDKLAYCGRNLELCVERRWHAAASGWRETIADLERIAASEAQVPAMLGQ